MSDREYHLAREIAERTAAMAASSEIARTCHASLADCHAERARKLVRARPRIVTSGMLAS